MGNINDMDCTDGAWLKNGTRTLGFSDTAPGCALGQYDADCPSGADPDQISRILSTAIDRCECQSGADAKDENTRIWVPGELACHAGSGRFALLPSSKQDVDADGEAFVTLMPAAISGNHLGRRAWVSSVSVVSWGDAARLVLPTQTAGWAFSTSDPDALDATDLVELDPTHATRTFATQTVGAGDSNGLLLSGWVKPVGTPTGTKLRFHVTNGSYGAWSLTNSTPPDLLKLP